MTSFLASSFFSTFCANILTGSLAGSAFFSTGFTSYLGTGTGFVSAGLVSTGLTVLFYSADVFSNPRILFVFHSGCALASLKSKSNHSAWSSTFLSSYSSSHDNASFSVTNFYPEDNCMFFTS